MSSHTPIFLKPGWTVMVDGVEMSYEEIRECRIDSELCRRNLKKLMKKQ